MRVRLSCRLHSWPRLPHDYPHPSPYFYGTRTLADHRASAKLFEDAAREDAEQAATPRQPSRADILEGQSENWTGDESMRDAVLRMLVDKYKPIRSGPIRSAEEKLKQAPPRVRDPSHLHNSVTDVDLESVSTPRVYSANEPILPSIEGHQPWHTTYVAPSHSTSSIRYGNIPPPSRSQKPSSVPLDDKARRQEKQQRRRAELAGRIHNAKESTLDYRLGLKRGAAEFRRPNPVSMKGWRTLVEEKIERARQEGHFNNIKGRGRPMARTADERNPFIEREEFLMNRIVQRQGAAPPWVEVQGELEAAVSSFREVVKQSWTRRAIRMLTASHPLPLLSRLTIHEVASHRDTEWEARERGYHDTALEELNALVRKYNGLAPYAVRRPYYMRAAELERVYQAASEDIMRGIAERANAPAGNVRIAAATLDDGEGGTSGHAHIAWGGFRLRDMFRELVSTMRGRR